MKLAANLFPSGGKSKKADKRLKVSQAVIVQIVVFWTVLVCTPAGGYRHFEGTFQDRYDYNPKN